MDFAKRFKALELRGNALHPEDDEGYKKYWKKLIDLLIQNEEQTIRFLETCSQDEALTISEVFDETSKILQSRAFIACLRKLDKKYPRANLTDFIDSAESWIEEN